MAGLAACSVDQGWSPPTGDVLDLVGPPIRVVELIEARPIGLDDAHGLARPADMIRIGDHVVISDAQNHEALVLDGRLDPVARVGGRGAGPGELAFPGDLEPLGDGFVVHDTGNRRVAAFGVDGTFRWVAAAPGHVSDLAVLDERAVVFPHRTRESRLTVRRDGRDPAPFGIIPTPLESDSTQRVRALSAFPLSTSDGHERIHYFDSLDFLFLTYDFAGKLQSVRWLPWEIQESIREENGAVARAFGGTADDWGAVSTMSQLSMFGAHPVAVFQWPLESLGAIALVLHPTEPRAVPIVAPDLTGDFEPLLRVTAMVLDEGFVLIVTDEGVFRYRVEFPPEWPWS